MGVWCNGAIWGGVRQVYTTAVYTVGAQRAVYHCDRKYKGILYTNMKPIGSNIYAQRYKAFLGGVVPRKD